MQLQITQLRSPATISPTAMRQEKTSVTVTKAWADNDDRGGHRPKEIKVQLKADGENSGEEITPECREQWTYTWSDLDQKKAGKDTAYTVEETGKVVGYIATVTAYAAEGFYHYQHHYLREDQQGRHHRPERTGRCSYPGDRQGWKCSRRVGFHMGSSRSNWPEAWRNLYPFARL